jgi:general secretion pathway protein A
MTHKLQALYGLKWNPFSPDVPVEALWRPQRIEHFCWRMENLVRDGGFALITGDPGTGKSVALRILATHLGSLPDVHTGVLTRPQSGLGDFYRELGSCSASLWCRTTAGLVSRLCATPGSPMSRPPTTPTRPPH